MNEVQEITPRTGEPRVVLEVVARIVVHPAELERVKGRVADEIQALAVRETLAGTDARPEIPHLRPVPEPERPRLLIRVPAREVLVDGEPVRLTRLEFDLLLFLWEHPGRVFERETLLRRVWHQDFAAGTRTVDVHVRRLRRKIGPVARELITTFRGVGYRLDRTDGTQVDYGA